MFSNPITFSSSAISESQDVSLYLDGEPDGDLVLSDPDDEKIIIVASNDTSQGQEQVIGNWTFDSLLFETGTGDSWSGNIYVISTKDISVSITWSFCQPSCDSNSISDSTVNNPVSGDGTPQIIEFTDNEFAGSSEPTLAADKIQLQISMSWTYSGIPDGSPTEISVTYGNSDVLSSITLAFDHLFITESNREIYHDEPDKYVEIWFNFEDSFGIEMLDTSLPPENYALNMGPSSESWTVDAEASYSNVQSDRLEVQFIWDYTGHTLTAGTQDYGTIVSAFDISDISWEDNFTVEIYTEEIYMVDITSSPSGQQNIAPGGSVSYQVTVENTGNVEDTYSAVLAGTRSGWDSTLSTSSFTLSPGASTNLQVQITASSNAQNGETDSTDVIINSDNIDSESLQLTTRAEQAQASYTFDASSDSTIDESWDFSQVTFSIDITNTGNSENDIEVRLIPDSNNLIINSGGQSIILVNDMAPGSSATIQFTVDMENDFTGDTASVEAKIKSLKDATEFKSLYFDIDVSLSGYLNLKTSNLVLECQLGSTVTYSFNIQNENTGSPLITYFGLEGISDSSSTNWFTFIDEDDNVITRSEPISLTPNKVEKITLKVDIPENEELGNYDMSIWMVNSNDDKVSQTYSFQVIGLEAESSSSSLMFWIVGLVILAFVGAAGYYFYNLEEDDEDDLYDADYIDDDDNFADEKPTKMPVPQATPAQATPAQATPVQATPAQATPVEATAVKATPVDSSKPATVVAAKPVEEKD